MQTRKWLPILYLTLLLVISGVGTTLAADLKVGIMNVQKIIITCDAGKKAKELFNTKMTELQTKFKAEEEDLKKLHTEIKKKSSAWSDEKKSTKEQELKDKGRELQRKTEEARIEMKQMQEKELEPILKSLEKVVDDYGAKNKFSMILDAKNGVVYFDKSVDITDGILKKLNETMKAK